MPPNTYPLSVHRTLLALAIVGGSAAMLACVGDGPAVVNDSGADSASDDSSADAGLDAPDAPACDAAIGIFPSAYAVCGDAGGVICVAPDAGLCAPSSQACSSEQGAPILCSNNTDCPGQHCCFTMSFNQTLCPWQGTTLSGSACNATCAAGTFQVCRVDGDCAVGTCHPVAAPFTSTGAFGVCK